MFRLYNKLEYTNVTKLSWLSGHSSILARRRPRFESSNMPKRACSSCRAKSASWPPRKARKYTSTTCTGGDQPTSRQPRNSCSPSRNTQPMPPQMQASSESSSVSSNSIQIDSAFACHCIECTKKTNCGCSCCCSFDCSKLRRHQEWEMILGTRTNLTSRTDIS
uniref:Uncharacterized protein n=1 Tax=Cacopsylla melanoneura TaxID=428564 RepID=A0A8D8V5N8_9HEMI